MPLYEVPTSHGNGWGASPEVPAVLVVPLKGTPLLRASSSREMHLPPFDMVCGIPGTPETRTLSCHFRPQIIDP